MNTARFTLLVLAAASVAACTRQESQREIDWARAALARNPQFEIVATDEKAGVFTVRETGSGAIRTLKLEELVAAPLPPRTQSAADPGNESAPAPTGPDADTPEADAAAAAPELASDQTTIPFVESPPEGPSLAEGPGYSITRGSAGPPERAAATLEGPGYRIERESSAPRAAASSPAPANTERRADPIICQGNRQMHIDGQTIEFTGDALIAEKGCDLFITNARIRAGGVGIIAREQARVHVVNSTIDGSRASYEASDGGAIYLARSTVQGVGRQFGGGTITDLGGNSYRTQ